MSPAPRAARSRTESILNPSSDNTFRVASCHSIPYFNRTKLDHLKCTFCCPKSKFKLSEKSDNIDDVDQVYQISQYYVLSWVCLTEKLIETDNGHGNKPDFRVSRSGVTRSPSHTTARL